MGESNFAPLSLLTPNNIISTERHATPDHPQARSEVLGNQPAIARTELELHICIAST